MSSFRKAAGSLAVALGIAGVAGGAVAQDFPSRPITLYVGLAAGGGTDLLARALAEGMSSNIGQPVVVENLPGASGTIAGQRVANADPDGYSLILVTASEAVLPAVRTDLPYDVTEAFAPVSLIAENAYLISVTSSMDGQTLQDFIGKAKAAPGSINYASAGTGSHAHIVTAAFGLAADIEMNHIPYKGGSEASVAVAAGNADMTLITPSAAKPLIESGKIKPLAITTGDRSELFPDVPTVEEAGVPDFRYGTWYALLTTAGTPDEVVQALNASALEALKTPALASFFEKSGMAIRGTSSADLGTHLRADIDRYKETVKSAGITLE